MPEVDALGKSDRQYVVGLLCSVQRVQHVQVGMESLRIWLADSLSVQKSQTHHSAAMGVSHPQSSRIFTYIYLHAANSSARNSSATCLPAFTSPYF